MEFNTDIFEQAKLTVMSSPHYRDGIGTLSEKSVHSVLKECFAPNEDCKEVKIAGMYADIFTGESIVEIQSASFDKLRRKLAVFLPLYPVHIVYPVIRTRQIILMDEVSGEVIHKRRSPLKGAAFDIFFELTKIRSLLSDERLSVTAVVMDAVDYRYRPTKKTYRQKHKKHDLVPCLYVHSLHLCGIESYRALLPDALPQRFCSKDFARIMSVKIATARAMLNVLHHLGISRRVGRDKQGYIYTVNAENAE